MHALSLRPQSFMHVIGISGFFARAKHVEVDLRHIGESQQDPVHAECAWYLIHGY